VLSRLFLRYAYPVHCRLAQDPLALIVLQNVMLALADPSGRYRVLDRVRRCSLEADYERFPASSMGYVLMTRQVHLLSLRLLSGICNHGPPMSPSPDNRQFAPIVERHTRSPESLCPIQ
jgi:hypothetical protein